MSWIIPVAPVGTPIQWFPLGRCETNTLPVAAQVYAEHPGGAVTVVLADSMQVIAHVPNMGDPAHLARNRDNQAQRGAWGFVPGLVPGLVPPTDEDEQRVISLLKTMTPADVATEMGDGWTSHRIAAVRREHKKRQQ